MDIYIGLKLGSDDHTQREWNFIGFKMWSDDHTQIEWIHIGFKMGQMPNIKGIRFMFV